MTNYNGDFLLAEMTTVFRLLIVCGRMARSAAAEPVLKIITPDKTVSFNAEEFAALPHAAISTLGPHGRKEHAYRGVAVRDLADRWSRMVTSLEIVPAISAAQAVKP